MATLAFPLALAGFYSGLRITTSQFALGESLNVNETAGGEILMSKTGRRLWAGTVNLAGNSWSDMNRAWAKVELLMQSNRPFFVYDTTSTAPGSDPGGAILGAAAPQIASIASDMGSLTLEALPANYVIDAPDMLAFEYLSGPTRYALHRVISGGMADATGVSPDLILSPQIRTGAAIGAAVTLVKAACLAVYKPGSARPPTHQKGDYSYGASFQFKQTLRGTT